MTFISDEQAMQELDTMTKRFKERDDVGLLTVYIPHNGEEVEVLSNRLSTKLLVLGIAHAATTLASSRGGNDKSTAAFLHLLLMRAYPAFRELTKDTAVRWVSAGFAAGVVTAALAAFAGYWLTM